MKKIISLILACLMIIGLCACSNNADIENQSEESVNNATVVDKKEPTEVNLGDTITFEFMEMTVEDFVICDELEVRIDGNTTMSLTNESEDKKTVYLTGKIKNLHTDMVGGTLGDIDCIFGNICFNEKYNYKYEMMINNKEDLNGTLQPLTTGDFYLYAQVPDSIAEEFTSCSVNFAFNENLSAIDLASSTDFDYKTCEYQYVVKGITK